MSQQTQIDRVVPKFQQFIHSFPSPRECADAPLSELLTIWQGLGYPRRCRNLHEAAKVMVRDHDSQVPADLEQLLALPGVGEYTARAVLAFAGHVDVGVVDAGCRDTDQHFVLAGTGGPEHRSGSSALRNPRAPSRARQTLWKVSFEARFSRSGGPGVFPGQVSLTGN